MIMDSLDEYLETVSGYIFDNDKLWARMCKRIHTDYFLAATTTFPDRTLAYFLNKLFSRKGCNMLSMLQCFVHKIYNAPAGWLNIKFVVTYKWLSKELEIHVNIAKQILWAFWQRYKEEKSFECSFLLMGVLHDSGMRVEVLKEKDLSKGKEKFAKIVSEHVYSLQKVLPEVQILGLAENGSIKHSAIKCLECNERNDKEMHMLRWGAISTEVQPIAQEKVESPPKPTNETIQKSPEKKSVGTKKSTQKKGFDNLFGKIGNKQKSPLSTTSSTEKMEESASNQTKLKSSKITTLESPKKLAKKGGLDIFLQQGKNSGKVTNSVPSEIKESTNSTTKENTEKKIMFESNNKQKKNKSNTRGQKRNRSKEVTAAVKKRKRITIESDSSDTELSDEDQEETEELPSPEKISPVRAHSPSPPKVKLEGGKCKVLKLVDKTFEEDGYFVTKKVHVYESCSEDEPEVAEAKKSVAPELHPEKKGKKTNTKQTNLMNYFRKS